MMTLTFGILESQPAPQTAAPAIRFRLRIASAGSGRIHAMALRAQVQIDARARRYSQEEHERLYELFGPPSQWDRALRPVLWSHTSLLVPAFDDEVELDLIVPCTYDLEVAAAKYLHGIRDGEIPLTFLFTGSAFLLEAGAVSVQPVPWDRDAMFRMPARVWRETMDAFFPGGGWIRLQQETLDRLQAFRGRQAVVSWDEALNLLLQSAEEPV